MIKPTQPAPNVRYNLGGETHYGRFAKPDYQASWYEKHRTEPFLLVGLCHEGTMKKVGRYWTIGPVTCKDCLATMGRLRLAQKTFAFSLDLMRARIELEVEFHQWDNGLNWTDLYFSDDPDDNRIDRLADIAAASLHQLVSRCVTPEDFEAAREWMLIQREWLIGELATLMLKRRKEV